MATKSNSPKRSLHIFDSIQSIFQSNNNHNHSFNHRHHSHDKGKHKHTHNHNVDKSEHQSNKAKPNTSQIKCNDSSHKQTKTKAKEDVSATVAVAAAAMAGVTPTPLECDDAAGGQKNDRHEINSSDVGANATTTTCVSSKMQNVTRILINSTNPQRQPNGKYIKCICKSTCLR